ncbi:hypothetical protein [Azospirillum baldaniorum]|uniref:hypothetical protein n=1 Tax=Azospirillum baldaniorum TaxID=1064539 RepID=UPI0011A77624|nr:hypothetical protein [Azospirillum baldaniorum]
MRRIINGRHRKPTGRYSSAKARRALPWEDKRERAFFWHCEADANVVAYLSQPHRLEIHVGRPRPLIYFPDLRRDLANGRVEIYEIKKAYNPDDDADYDLKLRLAADVYEGLGWSFRIIEAPEIERRPTLDTAWSVQRYRHVALSERDRFAVVTAIEGHGGTAPFQDVADVLGGGAVGMARLCAGIVRRIASIDITAPLEATTPVSLAAAPVGWLFPGA